MPREPPRVFPGVETGGEADTGIAPVLARVGAACIRLNCADEGGIGTMWGLAALTGRSDVMLDCHGDIGGRPRLVPPIRRFSEENRPCDRGVGDRWRGFNVELVGVHAVVLGHADGSLVSELVAANTNVGLEFPQVGVAACQCSLLEEGSDGHEEFVVFA